MKVAENREEPFKEKKGTTTYYLVDDTYYVQNTEDNRSRRDKYELKKVSIQYLFQFLLSYKVCEDMARNIGIFYIDGFPS